MSLSHTRASRVHLISQAWWPHLLTLTHAPVMRSSPEGETPQEWKIRISRKNIDRTLTYLNSIHPAGKSIVQLEDVLDRGKNMVTLCVKELMKTGQVIRIREQPKGIDQKVCNVYYATLKPAIESPGPEATE